MSPIEIIVSHLYAAKQQRSAKDDQIIADHIDAAYAAAVQLRAEQTRNPSTQGA